VTTQGSNVLVFISTSSSSQWTDHTLNNTIYVPSTCISERFTATYIITIVEHTFITSLIHVPHLFNASYDPIIFITANSCQSLNDTRWRQERQLWVGCPHLCQLTGAGALWIPAGIGQIFSINIVQRSGAQLYNRYLSRSDVETNVSDIYIDPVSR
jgi:hypothetical protein